MPSFPAPTRKHKTQSFVAYPINYSVLKERLEPFLPDEEFILHHTYTDPRLAKQADFSPVTIFSLYFNSPRRLSGHWQLNVSPAQRADKALIRERMDESGFSWLIEFLKTKRAPLWSTLYFERSIVWDFSSKTLTYVDKDQLNK